MAYRRLIEKEMQLHGKLAPSRLKAILEESIYGIERERDACYVTEFSLILTLLHYVDPPDLDKLNFKFPDLHNRRIFHIDFFDTLGEEATKFWDHKYKFDWIVGNPPWVSQLKKERDKFAIDWLSSSAYPVSGQRVAEAFSWRVTELLAPKGLIGLLLPATSLFNENSRAYREAFFSKHIVLRITNFANMRTTLFGRGKSSVLPAATVVYRRGIDDVSTNRIIHYAPFSTNQPTPDVTSQPWVLTINENEVTVFEQEKVMDGDSLVLKCALWGSFLDFDVLKRISHHFSSTLIEICEKYGWHFQEASQIRHKNSQGKISPAPQLQGQKRLKRQGVSKSLHRFSVSPSALEELPDSMCYIRTQGGAKGLETTYAPHIVMSPRGRDFVIYSDEDFILRSRYIGISAHESPGTADRLKALTVYLNSSLAAYHLFFHSHEWGVFRQTRRIITSQVAQLPVPDFNSHQVKELAELHDNLVTAEQEAVNMLVTKALNTRFSFESYKQLEPTDQLLTPAQRKKVVVRLDEFRQSWCEEIDNLIYRVFDIPEDMATIIEEFFEVRLALDHKSTHSKATRPPTDKDMLAYARQLKKELDEFAMGSAFHHVEIILSDSLVECVVEISDDERSTEITYDAIIHSHRSREAFLSDLRQRLRQRVSQWFYIQRGLRLFDGPRVHIYKTPRLIDWTRTQAMLDAHDLIGQMLNTSRSFSETAHTVN